MNAEGNNEDDGARQHGSEPSVRSVIRACSILSAFHHDDPYLTATQLVERTGLARPTLYRLLATLKQTGFVASQGDPLQFRLGPAITELVMSWHSTFDLVETAQPFLRRLWAESRETVALFTREGSMRVCVAQIASPQPLNFRRVVGFRDFLVRGATGRAILAFIADGSVDLSAEAAQIDWQPEELASALSNIRQAGYAYSASELIPGAVAIAAPLFRSGGEVMGSIGLLAPASRLGEHQITRNAQFLADTCLELSVVLGCERRMARSLLMGKGMASKPVV